MVQELADSLNEDSETDPLVRGAMAHLNLVMIRPFRDGNGRMARALQTLVISQHAIVEPQFSSIEEWLGHNTDDYYQALALAGKGSWQARDDAHLWLSFNLRAHHIQAQTVARGKDVQLRPEAAGIEDRTASRDLARLTDLGILHPHGEMAEASSTRLARLFGISARNVGAEADLLPIPIRG